MKLLFFIFLINLYSLSETSNQNEKGLNKKGPAPWIQLSDGNEMPSFGFGTSAGTGKKDEKSQKAIEDAIDAGYRLIDTAEYYQNEDAVGEAIKKKIQEGVIKREDMFVITKIWNNHHARDLVVPTLQESLKRLNLDYVDMYLIHCPVEQFPNGTIGDTDYMETWEGMIECQKLGLTKSIGVSNFNQKQLERIIKNSEARPAAVEIEVNPNLIQKKLSKFCEENKIAVIAYCPLGSMPDVRRKNNDAPAPTIDDPILTEIGQKYNKNTVQVVLRYLLDRNLIPIPKSTTASRIYANINVFDFKLTPDDVRQIEKFNNGYRIIDVPHWKNHKYYPFDYGT